MASATTLFFDVGGVLLTNGWDTPARERAATRFGLNPHEFDMRHSMTKTALEIGRLTLDQYLQRTVFYQERSFRLDEFKTFMYEQTRELPGSLAFVQALAATGRYRLCTLNNESAELNDYRISRFHLDRFFQDFFTSAYLHMVKPDEEIYRTALAITRCPPDRAIVIDDRLVNIETPQALGMQAIQFQDLPQLRRDLAALGVTD